MPNKDSELDECVSPTTKLLDDDWGLLDFTPTFMGEYRISPSMDEESNESVVTSTQYSMDCPQTSNFTTSSNKGDTSYTFAYDVNNYEKLPSTKDMEYIYGRGYKIFS